MIPKLLVLKLKTSLDMMMSRDFLGSFHVYLNSVQQMVSGELAGEGLQRGFSRHGLPPQRAPLDTVYPLREHLNSVQRMVSGGYCEGSFPDTVCWTRLRNTWIFWSSKITSRDGCFLLKDASTSNNGPMVCLLLLTPQMGVQVRGADFRQ